jgi:probable rRNA maturation factor
VHWTMILIEPTIQTRFGRDVRLRALTAFVKKASEAAGLRGEVSVMLTGDEHIRNLNREFRGKNRPTDVLSFPAPDPLKGHKPIAGDLAVSVETAARQAAEFGHPLTRELQILLLHGLLHLGGYDHETDTGQMAHKEAALRKQFGLEWGLIERSGHEPAGSKQVGARKRGKG